MGVKACADRDLDSSISGEAAEIIDDHETNAVPVILAVPQHLLKLDSLVGLGRLTFVSEDADNRPTSLGAMFNAPLLLGGEAQVLDLFFRGDAAVDHGVNTFYRLLRPSRLLHE